jgi:hypothetical protein
MDQDLFSFLDGDAAQDESMQVDPPTAPSKQRKRKANSPKPPPTAANQSGNELEPSPTKRPRVEAPNPLVLDDFETEAKREVAASAGLTGSTVESGTRLELRHQVRFYLAYHSGPHCSQRSATKSLYPLATTTSQYRSMSPQQNQTENTNLNSILFKGSPFTLYSGMRVSWFRPIPLLGRPS